MNCCWLDDSELKVEDIEKEFEQEAQGQEQTAEKDAAADESYSEEAELVEAEGSLNHLAFLAAVLIL